MQKTSKKNHYLLIFCSFFDMSCAGFHVVWCSQKKNVAFGKKSDIIYKKPINMDSKNDSIYSFPILKCVHLTHILVFTI